MSETQGYIDVVVGLQRGDEGKGRFVDMLAHDYDIVARFNGGDNAGHTVVLPDGEEFALHLMPSGITNPDTKNVIGNGTFVNPVSLSREIDGLTEKGITIDERRLFISSGAHLILPHHVSADEIREAGNGRQGSTVKGIAPVGSERALREGQRVEIIENDPEKLIAKIAEGLLKQKDERECLGLDQFDIDEVTEEYLEKACRIAAFATDTVLKLNADLQAGKTVLAEGAQAFLLDLDHGMYPYVTSSSTTSGGVTTGLGVAPKYIENTLGVAKAIPSHVGGGPFVTKVTDKALLQRLHGNNPNAVDAERGTTTGRVRDLGYLDIPGLRRANMVNGTDEIALTKLDWVPRYGEQIPICTSYERKGKELLVAPDSARKLEQCTPQYETLPAWHENVQGVTNFADLPDNAKRYIEHLEYWLDTPITKIGVGPRRDQVIIRD